jgi:mannan endo-1,4-beta-mannosidase
VRQALRQASHMGLNVMRVFAHTTDPNFPLQTAQGVYNEKVFKALDFVLVEVRRSYWQATRQRRKGRL